MKKVNERIGFDPTQKVYNKKICEIKVNKCFGLKRADTNFNPKTMQPFFSFDFYTWEYRSHTASGGNPTFEMAKRYPMDDTQELQEYLKY